MQNLLFQLINVWSFETTWMHPADRKLKLTFWCFKINWERIFHKICTKFHSKFFFSQKLYLRLVLQAPKLNRSFTKGLKWQLIFFFLLCSNHTKIFETTTFKQQIYFPLYTWEFLLTPRFRMGLIKHFLRFFSNSHFWHLSPFVTDGFNCESTTWMTIMNYLGYPFS